MWAFLALETLWLLYYSSKKKIEYQTWINSQTTRIDSGLRRSFSDAEDDEYHEDDKKDSEYFADHIIDNMKDATVLYDEDVYDSNFASLMSRIFLSMISSEKSSNIPYIHSVFRRGDDNEIIIYWYHGENDFLSSFHFLRDHQFFFRRYRNICIYIYIYI